MDDSLQHSLGSGPHAVPQTAQVGNYRIVRELGRGGQGVVYEVSHAVLNRTFALKLCLEQDEEGRQRFVREARLASQMTSPGLVRVHDYGDLEGRPYYVMELCRGEDLGQTLRRGPLEPERALRLLAGVADALAEIHSLGIVHRDIKPANLVFQAGAGLEERGPGEGEIAAAPGGERLRLTDFGLARPLGERSLTMSGDLIGSPAYMAPEQAIEAKSVDARADVYSLGAVLYECLTGSPPFLGATFLDTLQRALNEPHRPPSQIDASLAPYDELLADALAKEPGQRILDATAFRERLEGLLVPTGRRTEKAPPNLALPGAVAAALILVGVLGAVALRPSSLPTPATSPSSSPSAAALPLTPPPTPTPEAWTLSETRQRASAAWVASSAPPEVLAALDDALARAPEHQELRALRAGLRYLARQEAGARADLGRLLRASGEERVLAGLISRTLGSSPWGASLHQEALLGLRAAYPSAESLQAALRTWVEPVAPVAREPLRRALSAAAQGAPYAEFHEDLEAARAAAPDDLALKVWRARLLVGRDRYAEAKRAISWIQSERPPSAIRRMATRLEGDRLWRAGNLHDSPLTWSEASRGADSEAVIARAQAHWLGKPDQNRVEALGMVSDALREAPNHPRLLSLRCLFLLGSPWEGLRAADAALARGGAVDAQLLGFRAFAYQGVCAQAKLSILARAEWEGVFRVSEGAYYRVGASGLAMSSAEGRAWIRPYLEAVLKLEPERAHVHEYLGALALLDERPRDEILGFWRRAHELEPRNGLGRQWIGPYARRFGEVEARRLLGELPLSKR